MKQKNLISKIKALLIPLTAALGVTTPIILTTNNHQNIQKQNLNDSFVRNLQMEDPWTFEQYLANEHTRSFFLPNYTSDTVLSDDGFALPYYKDADDKYIFQTIFQIFPNENIAKVIAKKLTEKTGSEVTIGSPLYELDEATNTPVSKFKITNTNTLDLEFDEWLENLSNNQVKNSTNQTLTLLFGNPYINGINKEANGITYSEPWFKAATGLEFININMSHNGLWILPTNAFQVFNQQMTSTITVNLSSNRLTYLPEILLGKNNNTEPHTIISVADNNILTIQKSQLTATDHNINWGNSGNNTPIINVHSNSIYSLISDNGKNSNIWPSTFDLEKENNQTTLIESMLNDLKLTSYPVSTKLQDAGNYFLLKVNHYSDMSGNVKISIDEYNGTTQVENGVSVSESFTLNALSIGLIIDCLTLVAALIIIAGIIWTMVKRQKLAKVLKK